MKIVSAIHACMLTLLCMCVSARPSMPQIYENFYLHIDIHSFTCVKVILHA